MNYSRLVNAQRFYEAKDYVVVDAPWAITAAVNEITKPVEDDHLMLNSNVDSVLVASAEQSFLQLRVDGLLPDGKYQAITPCFRDEPVIDEIHQQSFMKLELIKISSTKFELVDVLEVVKHASEFFINQGLRVKAVETNEATHSIDLVCYVTGIELGSYGIRYDESIGYWIYGTGVAEPRCSYVLELAKDI